MNYFIWKSNYISCKTITSKSCLSYTKSISVSGVKFHIVFLWGLAEKLIKYCFVFSLLFCFEIKATKNRVQTAHRKHGHSQNNVFFKYTFIKKNKYCRSLKMLTHIIRWSLDVKFLMPFNKFQSGSQLRSIWEC